MKTSYGKLAWLAFILVLCAMLLLPMHVGQEDSLVFKPKKLKLAAGDSYHVSCSLSSETPDQSLSFETSNDRVAVINRDGTIRALASGEADITARASGGAKAKMKIIVSGVPMEALKLNVEELHLKKGEYSGLKVSFNEDASDPRLQWFSSDESIATVNNAGRVLAVSGGEAYISVLTVNGLGASCRVCVDVPGTAMRVSPDDLTLGAGAEIPLHVTFLPEDATDSVRSFVTSDPAVADVDKDGVLHATGAGTANINLLSQDGLSTSLHVSVDPAPKELRIEPSAATLERGDVLPLGLMFLEADGNVRRGTTHPVSWTSSDPAVASVDENGTVTALKSGSCRITADTDGKRESCDIKVRVSVQKLELNAEEVYLLKEDTAKKIRLKAMLTPADADAPTVFFESNNTQVAGVSPDGIVTMTGAYGTAVIRAYTADGAEAQFILNIVTELPGPGTVADTAKAAEATPVPVYKIDDSDDSDMIVSDDGGFEYEGEGYYDEGGTAMLGDIDIDYGGYDNTDEDFYANASYNR